MAINLESLEPDDKIKTVESRTVADSQVESENECLEEQSSGIVATSSKQKKKRSKKKRPKSTDTEPSDTSTSTSKTINSPNNEQLEELLRSNPTLTKLLDVKGDIQPSPEKIQDVLKQLKLDDIMTSLASNGRNVKDMASYKFWGTQPVPKFGTGEKVIEEGPFKIIEPEMIPQNPGQLIDGFEWVTMDLTDDKEIDEVFTLLYGHYVEDDGSLFRFNYSKSFLKWALMSPGWTKEWHVGVRATTSRKLVAFISAIPVTLRVRKNILHASEVNFLCVHKKLRSKRLAPVLIKEITRRCYLRGTWQAIYTAGIVLPKPISTCRYFHRSLDWQKLYEVGFSPLPAKSKPSYQTRKYALPEQTSTKNLRTMETRDVDGVLSLLKRYMEKFQLGLIFTKEDVEHWLVHHKDSGGDQIIWSYVVEDPTTKALTDFFSFYSLESSVINHNKHKNVRAAYLFYYASEHGLSKDVPQADYANHLNTLVNDALIIAKRYNFDVFNAMTLMDNNLFLEQQKFGAGDGQLHYYLYNYNANPIAGGVDQKNTIEGLSEVGVVMV
ncbi:Glycylpeptide N-tetradecanoyltransferase [Golovinomyces cichoracearum]|uniref:Glycylpeptide N-tetradecanoyltransferase n=1 Tax=Golovinomyces cichoracearum TaxID=62708 RepID=A0A420IZW3_9PEZI|nr:Glycylpeptide N-tetradecanoyltransferase [Golovinomyces cichoracearum]